MSYPCIGNLTSSVRFPSLQNPGIEFIYIQIITNKKSDSLISPLKIFRLSHLKKQKMFNDKKEKESLGRELNPRPLPIEGKVMVGPLPYQGNALPGWATKAAKRTIEPINHIIIIGRWLRSRFIYACLLTQPRACGGCRARPNRLTSLETRDLRSHKWVIPSLRGPWVQIPPPAPP